VLEGGSIDVNGGGTLLTTEECLLSKVQQRNAGMRRDDYEKVFSEFLGIKNVIWLGSGIAGDDTHGHVDDITRFVAPDTVVSAVESNPDDANYEPLRENLRRLREGVELEDGPTGPAEVELVGSAAGVSELRIVITEGRNRQVRRMFDAVDHEVRHLSRVAFGPVRLGRLKTGGHRRLRPAEIGAVPTLTAREIQVLEGMSHGRSNAEIGRDLFLSEDTVKTHARRLFKKLGASDRAHAVALGFRWGLVR